MQKRIFWSIFATALIAILIIGGFTIKVFHTAIDEGIARELRSQVKSIVPAVERLGELANDAAGDSADSAENEAENKVENYLDALPTDHRITLIEPSGKVIFDNTLPDLTEEHSNRPEIIAAARDGYGEYFRYSDSLTEKTFYAAMRLSDGRILRLAVTESSILRLLRHVLMPLCLVAILAAILSYYVSRTLARKITEPIGAIDPSAPLRKDAYEELSPLLLRLQEQNDTLRDQLRELKLRRHEQEAIIENMSEGLLMLDQFGTVLIVNRAAAKIFSVEPESVVGRNILTIDRSAELNHVVASAQHGKNGEAELNRDNRIYQLLSTPVAGETTPGIIVLLLDVTTRVQAERERREFTANVSHELRTPLTTISGYSEIMSNGLARPEDMTRFSEKIHEEAQRLITLINDIISLSRLDEKTSLPPFEDVGLFELCQNVMQRFQEAARSKNVSLALEGDHITLHGIPRLLEEMVFNLLDNAVKYNKEGGSVKLSVAASDKVKTLSVSDSGIGIPLEHQGRIFERFYRVDKSHSRETGGTGLGLAIVKHAAAVHGGKISLQSTPGEGSTFTIVFPNESQQ